MASVVDTSVKNFNSTMSGAPALSGTVGALVALLDALLVNGFDVKTATGLIVSGGVASVAFTGSHSAQLDTVISIAGITGAYASLNGEQKVTAVAAGVVRFATTLPDGAASGTITFKMAPAGFEKPFAKTNVAVYRSLDPMSSRMLLRVDDTNAQFARVVAYESMSDVDTGIGAFPTALQMSGGGYLAKSIVSSVAPVAWHLVADGRLFYHSIQAGSSSAATLNIAPVRGFGDPAVLRPSGDPYSTFLGYSANAASSAVDGCLGNNTSSLAAMPRAYNGLGSAVLNAAFNWGAGGLGNYFSGVTANLCGAFPNPVDGSLYLARKFLVQSGTAMPRADLPGLYTGLQSGLWDYFKSGDKTPGTGALTGRTLMALNCVGSGSAMSSPSNSSNTGVLFVDITGPWR